MAREHGGRNALNPGRCLLVSLFASLMVLVSSVSAKQATPVVTSYVHDAVTADNLPPAWLEIGPGGQLLLRSITLDTCPIANFDGRSFPMVVRAAASEAFPVTSCETSVPFGVIEASIGDQILSLPAGPLERIAVIGDTGCRLNEWEKKYQACNDPAAWPFAQVAASVAAWQPDLIVHVGDYLYRESPCPGDGPDCTGSPFGDNWETWDVDFFSPAKPLLSAAPLIFMRGNHETCGRNPEGSFRFLDPRAYDATCQTFTPPYVSAVNGFTYAAVDSAEAADENDTPEEAQEYASQFDELAHIAPEGAWLITHRPVWGVLSHQSGEFEVENATFATDSHELIADDFALILSGHIHLAETIAFESKSERPPQIISGNSGTALDNVPTASPTAEELGDPTVEEAETLSSFGFLTLEPLGDTWLATQRDASGTRLQTCVLDLPEITCA
jgi:hypothetical protein